MYYFHVRGVKGLLQVNHYKGGLRLMELRTTGSRLVPSYRNIMQDTKRSLTFLVVTLKKLRGWIITMSLKQERNPVICYSMDKT